jgi:hypothetical protein
MVSSNEAAVKGVILRRQGEVVKNLHETGGSIIMRLYKKDAPGELTAAAKAASEAEKSRE